MYEYAKNEFGRWLSHQDVCNFNEYQKALIGLLIDHFDEIASASTAKGGRAKILAKYIQEIDISEEGGRSFEIKIQEKPQNIQRLMSLRVERFRGFGTPVDFSFEKQYTLFHGANGSGKTSFCEALEYTVLGTIEEASARGIPIDKYILHAGDKKPILPILNCRFSDGNVGEGSPDLATYRFAFIEKNRIEAFSHIGATTIKNQTERIAALFGLSEFQAYVSGFTASLDDRYIKLKSDATKLYKEKKESVDLKKNQIEDTKKQVAPAREALKKAISSLNVPDIVCAEDAKKYLSDPETGQIPILEKQAINNKKPLIDQNKVEELETEINALLDAKRKISEKASIILENIESVNLLALYNAIIGLETTKDNGVCPACQTPLEEVVQNPFEYAKTAVVNLSQIEEAKAVVSDEARKAAAHLQRIKDLLRETPLSIVFPDISTDSIVNSEIVREDFEALGNSVNEACDCASSIATLLSTASSKETMVAYNIEAKEDNEKQLEEIDRLQSLLSSISEKNAAVEAVDNTLNTLVQTVTKESEELLSLKMKAEEDDKIIDFNKKMVEAYNSIVQSLKEYADSLPLEISHDLAKKTLDYYNAMNCDDAEFELLSDLTLPVSQNDRIIITMNDGTKQDAMLLLSEGHVKLLGLAILLSKAIQLKMPFIIFDDIVNAIDDDHRDGVAKLLIENPDFADVQMILTCHGEVFVSKLEEFVKDKKEVERYMFLPADSLDERGVVIHYQDPSVPLIMAREKYEEGSLKDCAAKCRQAVECITGKLWVKLAPYINGGISVKMRDLKKTPDLYQVTTALTTATDSKYVLGAEMIHDDLKKLTKQNMWSLLNKGTHVDGTIPEFSRTEIHNLLELIEHLSSAIKEMKLKAFNTAVDSVKDKN